MFQIIKTVIAIILTLVVIKATIWLTLGYLVIK